MNSEGWPEPAAGIGHNSGEVEIAPVVKYEVKYPGQPETEEPEAFRLRRNAEIEHWLNSKPALENAKQIEMDWRNKVSATLFPNPVKGTQRYDLGGGFKVKLVHGLTYSLGNKEAVDDEGKKIAVRTQVEDLEQRIIDKFGDVGDQLIKRLISWKPELSGSEYEKLDPDNVVELEVRNMIDEVLTIKPASPQLAFEEPKAK